MAKPVAVLCADLHLNHEPPGRRVVSDWYDEMGRVLGVIRELVNVNHCVICAGDVFHRWKSYPQLVNWAIDHLPVPFYSIPGQHDLPYHQLDELEKSAYCTLVKAGVVDDLGSSYKVVDSNGVKLLLCGFPWGSDLVVSSELRDVLENFDGLKLAVVHKYLWYGNACYDGVTEDSHVERFKDFFGNFDVAVIGDNHAPFDLKLDNGCVVWNCGCLLKRSLAERNYPVRVGVLMSDGSVYQEEIDKGVDYEWMLDGVNGEDEDDSADDVRLGDFMKELSELELNKIDFVSVINRLVENKEVDDRVAKEIFDALEECI